MKHLLTAICLAALFLQNDLLAAAEPEKSVLYSVGEEGFTLFRIPSLIVSPKGTLLAFIEGRRTSRQLTGDIEIMLRRSTDGGKTWSAKQIVAEDGVETLGNPCPVIDHSTGTIWMPFTRSIGADREIQIIEGKAKATTVWLTKSTDDGVTWAKPIEISPTARKDGWTWYGTGPGVGIQLESGRLLVPSYHAMMGLKSYRSHMLYSDDHGKTWVIGDSLDAESSECQVVERHDGSIHVNARGMAGNRFRRLSESKDGGKTWAKPTLDENLPDADCQGSIVALAKKKGEEKRRWLFANVHGPKREDLMIHLSEDEGKTWPVSRKIESGLAAYSCLTELPDGSIGCLYERGPKRLYDEIVFAKFTLDWLRGGK